MLTAHRRRGKSAKALVGVLVVLLHLYKPFLDTITAYNGTGLAKHECIARKPRCHVYFAQPSVALGKKVSHRKHQHALPTVSPKSPGLRLLFVCRPTCRQTGLLEPKHKFNRRPGEKLGL